MKNRYFLLTLSLILCLSSCTVNGHDDKEANKEEVIELTSSYKSNFLRAGKDIDKYTLKGTNKTNDKSAYLKSRYTISNDNTVLGQDTTYASKDFETYDFTYYYKTLDSDTNTYKYTKVSHYWQDYKDDSGTLDSSKDEFDSQKEVVGNYYEACILLYTAMRTELNSLDSASYSLVQTYVDGSYYYYYKTSNTNYPALTKEYYFIYGTNNEDTYLSSFSYKATYAYSSYSEVNVEKYAFYLTNS